METTGASVSVLFRKFQTCESYVRHGKIAACIILFLEVLEKIPAAPLLTKEKKLLIDGIYKLQRNLAAHQNFKDLFGPVTFDDTDLKTTYEFLKQLHLAHEEELRERMKIETTSDDAERLEVDAIITLDAEAIRERGMLAIEQIDGGDIAKANEIVDGMDEVISFIIDYYNNQGIQHREAANYNGALASYMKALAIYQHDEGLYYNVARAYNDLGEQDKAQESLNKALEINPQFQEGHRFHNYLLKQDASNQQKGNGGGLWNFLKKFFSRKKADSIEAS
jgi:tetratricopeptide (TPR) repeat protein